MVATTRREGKGLSGDHPCTRQCRDDRRYQLVALGPGAPAHLWVSVKQTLGATGNSALSHEESGFGRVATTWLQSRPHSTSASDRAMTRAPWRVMCQFLGRRARRDCSK